MWDKGGTVRAGDFIYLFIFFFLTKEMKIMNWEQDFFCKPVKRVEFVSDAMSFISSERSLA